MTRTSLPLYETIPFPFAMYGETDVLYSELDPLSSTSDNKYFDASYQWDGTTKPSKFITRQLINKLFAQMSGRQFLQQCGYIDTFDQKVCDAIGGYPQGAVLKYLDGDVLYDVISLTDSNTVDYTKSGIDNINWKIYGSSIFSYVYPDYGSHGTSNIASWTVSEDYNDILGSSIVIPNNCFVQAFINNTRIGENATNLQCGILLSNGNTSTSPSSLPDNYNPLYMTYELYESGTVMFPVFAVSGGTKVSAFSVRTAGTVPSYKICLRFLTPLRLE